MIFRIEAPVVPFDQALPETQASFVDGLRTLRGIDEPPKKWNCTRCGSDIDGSTVYISYNVPTSIPFCMTPTEPGRICGGSGSELVPAADAAPQV